MTKIDYCIDNVVSINKGTLVEGWVYKQGFGNVDIKVVSDCNAEISIVERGDILLKYDNEEKAKKAGFKIVTMCNKKIEIEFIAGEETLRAIIDPPNKNQLKKNIKKAIKFLKLINVSNFKKITSEVKMNGLKATVYKTKHKLKKDECGMSYDKWIRQELPSEEELEIQRKASFEYSPKISIVMPTYNTKPIFLERVIESVKNQTYSNWELCIADGASTNIDTIDMLKEYSKKDERIKVKFLKENYMISGNSNEGLKMVTGEYVALLDHDDVLTLNALYEYIVVLNNDREVEFIYSDEDKIDEYEKEYFDPHFKQDWAPDTFRSNNYICHFSVFSKKLLDKVGYFNHEFDGSQDYDMILRLTEKANKVVHIPKVLYHWRVHRESTAGGMGAKSYAIDAGRRALEAHLSRIGEKGSVVNGKFNGCYRVNFDIIGDPRVSIIIPNKDEVNTLSKCIDSILKKTTYSNYEIIIVENNSVEEKTFKYYKELEQVSNVKVVIWEREFNYSAINNFGVKNSSGEFIVLLNNDVEIISEGWIQELLMHAQREETGAVGAKLYYPDDTIQHYGVLLGVGGVAEHQGKGLSRYDVGHMGRLIMKENVMAVTGACLMVDRKLFDRVGGLNEDLAVAYNDVDFCLRLKKLGYTNMITPYAELYHHESKTRGLDNCPEKSIRLENEMKIFNSIWGYPIEDPYYSINFSKERGDFNLARR
ncbi:MAG: glycosyltransferase family 2 protein [Clostridium sp.]|uniref:glycosyltransferase family 2 protein n=1 Tax=Clostridium sp. TaxID=1506 RepID=UPI00291267A1|nr:glycosyltransferase family 2 protein [Clostridium sp.]MDU4937984.1 glycosyltransferase family 2 protein [Clostridium sp.]